MRRLAWLALLAAGCGDGKGYLEVRALGSATGIDALAVTVTLGGVSQRGQLAVPGAPASLPLTFAVTTDPLRFGTAQLHVEALGGGRILAAGDGAGELRAGEVTQADVVLTGAPLPDGGVDLAMNDFAMNDFAMNDLAMNDLAMNDLVMNDLAMNDLAMNDLAMNDLAMPDLSMPDLTPPPDLVPPPDLTPPPDLQMPDLQMPDLQMPDLVTVDVAMCVDDGTACAGKNCGTRTNNCGAQVSCGPPCPNGGVCVANVCCAPQTNQQFCTAHNAACGSVTAADNCGTVRTVNCGACNNGLLCSVNNQCVVCRTNSDCAPVAPLCGNNMSQCLTCTDANDCAAGGWGNVCDNTGCHCASDLDCTNPRAPRCSNFNGGTCVCGVMIGPCAVGSTCSSAQVMGTCQ